LGARKTALLSLTEWESGDRNIDVVLERRLAGANLDTRDTALAQNLTYGVLRWKGRIDWVLDQYVKGGLTSLPVPIRNALRLGLYQIDYLDRIPPRAAVNESVELAKEFGHKGTAGLVNAVLRNILTSLRPDFPDLRKDPVGHISVVYSHPRVLVERWMARYGVEMTVVFCEYNNEVPRLVARANGLSALTGGDVSGLNCFKTGMMQIQDESTLLAVRLLDPQPGEQIIDMCAAPGGKTTYIAERMLGEGTIKAFEISEPRAAKLTSNIERLSIKSCDIIRDDAIAEADGTADGVLIDAPCTGTGTLGRRADSRWKFDLDARERVRSDIKELKRMHPRQIFARQVERQLRFLLKAATLVEEGGRIVYSTCSMEPEENEQVIARFLDKRPDFALEDAADFVPPMFVDGGFVRVLPHKHAIDGAFAARLIKSGREPLAMEAEESTELAMEAEEVG